ncbi:MAG TPA: hypothetical protein VJB16_00860, partial [archaeon]|nr:hypothetical protein [archaeon]
MEVARKAKSMKATTGGKGGGDTLHSFSDEEKKGYVDYVNSILGDDPVLASVMPLNDEDDSLFKATASTLLLSKVLAYGFPADMDIARLNANPSNAFQQMENHSRALDAAKKIGCSIVNIAAEDISAGTPHLVLGVVWQLIKKNLLKQVQELSAAEEQAMGNLPPEQILFKWMNAHLKAAGCPKTVSNWDKDLSDGSVYAYLMHHIEPNVITKSELQRVLGISDQTSRVEGSLDFAERLGCRKFVTVQEVVKGNPRLNLAFVATLFKAYPNMPSVVDEGKFVELKTKLDESETTRTAVAKERDSLTEAVGRHLRELEERDGKLAETARSLDTLRAERDRLSSEREKLAESLMESNRAIDAKQAELDSALSQKEELVRSLKNERDERERLQKKLQDTMDEMAATVTGLEKAQASLQAQLAA